MVQLLGCDISGYQPPYPDLSGKQFVIIKSTQGTVLVNANYHDQLAHARSDPILIIGHYHFPDWGDPVAECDAFIDQSDIQNGEFVGLDIEASTETPWPADPVGWCKAWEEHFIARKGFVPLSYTNWSIRRSWNWQPLVDLNSGCWDAAYNPNGPGDISPWLSTAIWQNADTDSSGGDSDIFYGDADQLRAYGYKGEIEVITPDDINNIVTAVYSRAIPREGANQTGETNLQELIANSDANFNSVQNTVIDTIHSMTANVTLTQDEINSLANAVATQLNANDATVFANAVLAAVKAQWNK